MGLSYKNPKIVQKLELGGLAVPDISKYYYALVVTKCLDWWRLSDNADIILLEQNQSKLSLAEGLVRDKQFRGPLQGINPTAVRLNTIWNRCQVKLIPPPPQHGIISEISPPSTSV